MKLLLCLLMILATTGCAAMQRFGGEVGRRMNRPTTECTSNVNGNYVYTTCDR